MKQTNRHIKYILLLLPAFAGQILPRVVNLPWGSGLATLTWIFLYLRLSMKFRKKSIIALTGLVFCAGYYLRFMNAFANIWQSLGIFIPSGLALYGIIVLYSALQHKYKKLWGTMILPTLWMLVYFIATLLRLPALVRIDMMLTDMTTILHTEAVIGSSPMMFIIIWSMSLLSHAVDVKKNLPVTCSLGLIVVLIAIGTVRLFPNVPGHETVKVAYSIIPYGGSFMDYTKMPYDGSISHMRSSAFEAAAQGAEILVFNEETYELDDNEADEFISQCCVSALENGIHMLVGFDITDTDNSHDGKSLNMLYWIDKNGSIAGSYQKTNLLPIIEADYIPGNGSIPSHVIDTSKGSLKVSYLICYDSNFPGFVRNIDDDTDILFLPSWDWNAVTELHTRLCEALAIENSVSLLKPTYDGITIAIDDSGTVFYSASTDETGFDIVKTVDMPYRRGAAAPVSEIDGNIMAITAIEIMSLLVCVILLLASKYGTFEKSPRNTLYKVLVSTNITALVADSLSWILDGHTRLYPLLYFSTLMSVLLTFVMLTEFVYYITEFIREVKPISYAAMHITGIISIISIAVVTIESLKGGVFYFENGQYNDGPLYNLYVYVNFFLLMFIAAFLFYYRRNLEPSDRVAAFLYISIPGIASILNAMFPEWSLTYPSITLSLLIVYVLIQSDTVGKLASLERITSYNSLHDEMTGLPNRRAYEEKLKALAASGSSLGVVFSDMNGLKYANDHYGHSSGDQLILRFTGMLCQFFRREEIYRISGDEFVILLPDIKYETFKHRMQLIKNAVASDSVPIACLGSDYGNACDVTELIYKAEAEMYTSKQKFHTQHPELAR